MDLTKKEIKILQEQLVLIYKLIYQDNTFKSFYFKDISTGKQPESKSHLINELNKLENSEGMLKSCIVELEELKRNKDIDEQFFYEIMAEYRLRELKEKYDIVDIGDIDKLGIEKMIKKILNFI